MPAAYAASPRHCTLSHMKQDRVWLASEAGRYSLTLKLKETPRPRLRTEIPEFLKQNQQFNSVVLDNQREVKVLEFYFNQCLHEQIASEFGYGVDLRELVESEKGRQFMRALDEHIRELWAAQPTLADKTACYQETQPDLQDGCWRSIAQKTMASVLAAQSLQETKTAIDVSISKNQGLSADEIADSERKVYRQYFEAQDQILLTHQKIRDEEQKWHADSSR